MTAEYHQARVSHVLQRLATAEERRRLAHQQLARLAWETPKDAAWHRDWRHWYSEWQAAQVLIGDMERAA